MWPLIYNWILFPLFRVLATLAATSNDKIRTSISGKKGVWDRLDKHLEGKVNSRKTIWFHAPSAGEFIQVQPLLEMFLNDDYQCVLTYNSISAEKWIAKTTLATKNQPLFTDYLPIDTVDKVQTWLKKLNPSALVLVKYDLWPNLIWETRKAGIPIYLTSATIHEKTKRYISPLGRSFYRNLYSQMTAIYTVTEEDKKRFLETNPALKRIEVVGDTRFDATIQQRERVKPPAFPEYIHQKRVFIVGSCWPPDEEKIFPALKESLNQHSDLVLVIAPHEPTEDHVKSGEEFFAEFNPIRFSTLDPNDTNFHRVIVIDSIGILSSIYKLGHLGYVGGGYTTGVHNVMEPCARGLPVFFGPKHYNSGEALHLAKEKLAFPIKDESDFRDKLVELLDSPSQVEALGEKAKEFIESQCGASQKCFTYITKEING